MLSFLLILSNDNSFHAQIKLEYHDKARTPKIPFSRFLHILFTPIFSYVYYHAEYFSYP